MQSILDSYGPLVPQINFIAAWVGICVGLVGGALIGLRFHSEQWLGGYASWPRRLVRLGHISCFGIALLNLGFGVTVQSLGLIDDPAAVGWGLALPSMLLIVGAITMPIVCTLAAWRKPMRQLFPVPVLSLVTAAVTLTVQLLSTLVIAATTAVQAHAENSWPTFAQLLN